MSLYGEEGPAFFAPLPANLWVLKVKRMQAAHVIPGPTGLRAYQKSDLDARLRKVALQLTRWMKDPEDPEGELDEGPRGPGGRVG